MSNFRSLVLALHRHWDVVEHLVRLTRESPAFEREQALAVIRAHMADTETVEHERVLQQLLTVDVLQWLPRTNNLQINALVLEFVRGLTKEHELGLSEVLRARIEAVKDATTRLAESLDNGDRDMRRQSANRLSELFRQIAQQLTQDQDAILGLAEEAKSATDSLPINRRYQKVLDAYDRYVEPMNEMMDTGINGAFYRHLEQAEQVLDRAVARLEIEGALYSHQRAMRQVAYQAKALRSQGRQAVKTCTETLLPLREELRQHSVLASAVSLLLGEVRTKGLTRSLKRGSPPFWQRERATRLALGSEVLTIMSEARNFEPNRVAFPSEDESAAVAIELELVDESTLHRELEQAIPVNDLLGWLHDRYGHVSDATLLRLYNGIVASDQWQVTAAPAATSLDLKEVRVRFHPHRINRHD